MAPWTCQNSTYLLQNSLRTEATALVSKLMLLIVMDPHIGPHGLRAQSLITPTTVSNRLDDPQQNSSLMEPHSTMKSNRS